MRSSAPGHASAHASKPTIDSGDVGIFVTFEKGKDGKCLAEAKDLFGQVSHIFDLLYHGLDRHVESNSR
jgi:hypothetical protein